MLLHFGTPFSKVENRRSEVRFFTFGGKIRSRNTRPENATIHLWILRKSHGTWPKLDDAEKVNLKTHGFKTPCSVD